MAVSISQEKWRSLSLATQLTHIDSELGRAEALLRSGDRYHVERCLSRALDLLTLTLSIQTNPFRRREIARLKEVCAGAVVDHVHLKELRKYFEPFAAIVARERNVG